ncbi:MAG: hypothetical protein J7D61_17930, partial [Marichromatium sp.]|nr:hypothetical protein [Marichromatium sp.]
SRQGIEPQDTVFPVNGRPHTSCLDWRLEAERWKLIRTAKMPSFPSTADHAHQPPRLEAEC